MRTVRGADGALRTYGVNWPVVLAFLALCALALAMRLTR